MKTIAFSFLVVVVDDDVDVPDVDLVDDWGVRRTRTTFLTLLDGLDPFCSRDLLSGVVVL